MKAERKKVLLILEWCENKFGKSKFQNDFPSLSVYKSKGSSIDKVSYVSGTFSFYTNRITVYAGTISNYEMLCGTILHEYKHYLLNGKEYDKMHINLRKKGFTDSEIHDIHPHEIKCRKHSDKWKSIAYAELKSQLRKK